MKPLTRKSLHKEIGKFSFVGIIATSIDFFLLNISMLLFGLPLIASNIIAASVSSVISFTLNKRLTFDGQRHGHTRTIVRYVLIVGISVYVIQNIILYLLSNRLLAPTDMLLDLLSTIGISGVDETVANSNFAKFVAVYTGSVWNFLLLRKFVFSPTAAKES